MAVRTEERVRIQGTANQVAVFHETLRELAQTNARFAIGGSLATASYLARDADIKDLDIYVTPDTAAAAITAVTKIGLEDYYVHRPYQRHWLYRATRGDAIVDIIWAMANSRAEVDEEWITRGHLEAIDGESARIIPIEELIWSKMYVLQFDRCDWPELMNLILAVPQRIDWKHLVSRLGSDLPLLKALLEIASWLNPDWKHGLCLPPALDAPALPEIVSPQETKKRAALLDGRAWLMVPPKGDTDADRSDESSR